MAILDEVATVSGWRRVATPWLPASDIEAMSPAFAALDTVPRARPTHP